MTRHETYKVGNRWLEEGVEYTVRGQGRFRFLYATEHAAGAVSITGISAKSGQTRSFRPEAIKTVHNKAKMRGNT